MQSGGLSGVVLNGAKEAALEAFIAGKIPFLLMAQIVEAVMQKMGAPEAGNIEAVHAADSEARRRAGEFSLPAA